MAALLMHRVLPQHYILFFGSPYNYPPMLDYLPLTIFDRVGDDFERRDVSVSIVINGAGMEQLTVVDRIQVSAEGVREGEEGKREGKKGRGKEGGREGGRGG